MHYVPFLDGLRCISILWVILIHLRFRGDRLYEFVASHGWMGVDMFFVISGYLITTILLREYQSRGRISLRNFYVRRILRIWPAYYMTLAIVAALALAGIGAHPEMVLRTIRWPAMYLTNAYAGFNRTESCALLVSWSLSLEEQFYLLWPLLLFFGPKRALKIAIATIVAVTVWRTWLTFHIAPGMMAMRRLFYAPDTRIDVILYGCVLAFILLDERRAASIGRFLKNRATPFILAIAFLIGVDINNRWSGHLGNSIGYSVSALLMAVWIAYIATARPKAILSVLQCRPMVYIGRISYGIYLLHEFAIEGARFLFGNPTSIGGKVAFGAFVYGGAILLASVSYRYFESPFLRLKQRFSARESSLAFAPEQLAAGSS